MRLRTGIASAGVHRTAPYLLSIALVISGLVAISRLNTQFFPDLEHPVITVSVAWPGAGSERVDETVLAVLESELSVLDELASIKGVARDGQALVRLEFLPRTDMTAALGRVEQRVSRIESLPDTSEPAVIEHQPFYEPVATLLVAGPVSEDKLGTIARKIRADLLEAGVGRVVPIGLRDREIWVRVNHADRLRLGISLEEISNRIARSTRSLPAGLLERNRDRRIDVKSGRDAPDTLAKSEILARDNGQRLLLGDIATIGPGFDKDAVSGFTGGHPAIQLKVQRAHGTDTLETMALLESYVASSTKWLPPDVRITVTDVRGKFIKETLSTLTANALQGLALVLLALFLFLHWRIAIWVAAGIPIALLTALAVMAVTGQSLNVISLLALIMMLGVVVDDAIIVGEHAEHLKSQGLPAADAAVTGAAQMLSPVLVATLTTLAAFLPILFVTGQIGAIMSAIPFVVSAVLVASLFECFFVLPGHLRHALAAAGGPSAFRRRIDGALARFRDGPFDRFLGLARRWRYVTLALAASALLVSASLLGSGHVGFSFFTSPEAEKITAAVQFTPGTPTATRREILEKIEAAADDAARSLGEAKHGGRLILSKFAALGSAGPNLGRAWGEVSVQLEASEARSIRTADIVASWKERLPLAAEIEQIALREQRSGPRGRDIEIKLTGASAAILKQASDEARTALAAMTGVRAIDDDLAWGEPKMDVKLTPLGTALGFTAESLGTQIRNAVEGAIATHLVVNGQEIAVRVLHDQPRDSRGALRDYRLLTPSGGRVAVEDVVTIDNAQTFSAIHHENGRRTVTLSADLDRTVTTPPRVMSKLAGHVLPGIANKYGIDFAFAGRAEERNAAFGDLRLAAVLAAMAIFMILAWSFESYGTPLVVMAIIPFGAIGAILGHWLMGCDVTIISIIGFLGLSGIMLNDAIILLKETDRQTARAADPEAAILAACKQRLRAVMLTTITTALGLAPLLFETSRNAQFLKPMAITMIFGLVASSVLVLVLLPVLASVRNEISRLARRQRPSIASFLVRRTAG